MNKKNLYLVIALGIVVIATVITKQVLFGSAKAITLNSAPPLAGIVSQSLYAAGGETTLLVPGQDFDLTNIHYFDDNTWAVVTIKPLKNNFNQSMAILQKQNGVYAVVAGPGSAFPNDYLQSLPADVGNYLQAQGVLYVPVNE